MDDFIPIINKAHGKAIIKETAVIPNIFTITSYCLVCRILCAFFSSFIIR